MPHELESVDAWKGLLDGRSTPAAMITLRAPRQRARSSGAGAFFGLADDGRQYWIKVPGNEQGDQVLVNEVIVAGLGRLLGAPVRERVLITVPASLTNWSDFPVRSSETPMLAHGSLHVPGAEDADDFRYTRRDGNAQRQAAMIALWDLCLGDDPQWLYETSAAFSMWSYDHGFWFTTGEGDWDAAVLQRIVGLDGSVPQPPTGLDSKELLAVAERIERLDARALLSVMSAVPVEWGTDDGNLEVMAWFLFRRRTAVAHRLRTLAGATSGDETTGTPI